jgi:tetratricopeptide (TPR) repeat protein
VNAVLVVLVVWALLSFWQRWIRGVLAAQLAAWRRGDYEGQMQAAAPLRVWKPRAYLFLRGSGLFHLGRLQEAEACLLQSLLMEKNRRLKAVAESQLGHVLLAQQRYADAIAWFGSSIADWSQRGGGHRGIAETLLLQGVQPAEALRQARQAAELDEVNTALGAESRDISTAESLATLAWAEAVNSGSEAGEVERLLSKAFTLCPETTVPVRAKLHYLAGRAYAALGKTEESAREFERAAKLDPKGTYGRSAKAAMP